MSSLVFTGELTKWDLDSLQLVTGNVILHVSNRAELDGGVLDLHPNLIVEGNFFVRVDSSNVDKEEVTLEGPFAVGGVLNVLYQNGHHFESLEFVNLQQLGSSLLVDLDQTKLPGNGFVAFPSLRQVNGNAIIQARNGASTPSGGVYFGPSTLPWLICRFAHTSVAGS